MKESTQSINRGEFYITPLCTSTDIVSEGVMCGSMQQLEEYEDEYKW